MTETSDHPAGPPRRAGFGKLLWIVGPLAILTVAWQFLPRPVPRRSPDVQQLQNAPSLDADLDRYAAPVPAPGENSAAPPPEESPSTAPDAGAGVGDGPAAG